VLHDPKLKDARGYIVPADQPDFPTATKFIKQPDEDRRESSRPAQT